MQFATFVITVFITTSVIEIKSDEIPGFFLKVAKNVPRIGRRSSGSTSFENYFRKASKSVPRIGRRSGFVESDPSSSGEDNNLWYDHLINPSKKSLVHPMNYYGYNLVQPMDSNTLLDLISRDLFPSDKLRFIPWRDFDDLLQKDEELYSKVVSLGRDPSVQFKDDLNFKDFDPLLNNDLNNDHFYYKTIENDDRSGRSNEMMK